MPILLIPFFIMGFDGGSGDFPDIDPD